MDISVLEKSALFKGIPTGEIQQLLQTLPYHIRSYKKDETIFHMMDSATQIGFLPSTAFPVTLSLWSLPFF